MVDRTRRSVIKASGAVLGGIAVGSTAVSASGGDGDRFIVRTKGNAIPDGVDVVHEMPGVDLAVVRGDESVLQSSRGVKSYAPDPEGELGHGPDIAGEPVNTRAPSVEEADVSPDDASVDSGVSTEAVFYPYQWDKQDLNVADALGKTIGEGTRVAILDTGVAAGHPDLDVDVGLSRDFTGDGYGAGRPIAGYHGTHVAGIAGARGRLGTIGTAPGAELVDCRVFSPFVQGSFGDVLAAVVYSAAIDADVANLSLGAYPIPRQGLGSFYGKALNRVMTYANSRGTLLVVAAGNDAADLQHDGSYISLPNEGAQGMSISATGPGGFGWDAGPYGGEEPAESPAIYTNYGTNAVDLGAPGGDFDIEAYEEYYDGDAVAPLWYLDMVLNTVAYPVYDGTDLVDVEYNWSWVAGTSMAAPQVAGAAALVKSTNPGYNANQIESALERAADVPAGYDKSYYGSGYLNLVDAL
ncbi:peptidase S8 and S53 subtilisin kexin sedolisin [Halobacteriales archaeon QS_8_69_26]|nr:MAG: peptidase S8 and S53 subtilisin kexin sedolisin [Halobacteriales archaeon QS_8_69_26]